MKHDRARAAARDTPLSWALFVAALGCSAALGFLAGQNGGGVLAAEVASVDRDPDSPRIATPPLGRGRAVTTDDIGTDPIWAELGRVRAEILRLRILFRRLAGVAELDDGEFDLGLEPLELPEVRDAFEALDLSIRALDPISVRSSPLARIFDERRRVHDRRPSGTVVHGAIRSSGFGLRLSPFGGRRQLHRGADLAGSPGAPVHALAAGVVVRAGQSGGYGNLVEIEHGDGYRTLYAHNESNLVALGERVGKGDVIATLGSSGRSTGPHVHVEVHHHGVALDPARFIR